MQATDLQLKTDSTRVKQETVAGANSAARIGELFENLSDSKINKDAIDTAATLDTADKTLASRDAIKAFVLAAVAALVDSSPAALNTLKELATALGNDANFAASMTTALAAKISTSEVDTAASLATAGKTIPGRDAVKAYITSAIAALVNSSPAALDTLNELALALGNDANFAATVTNALAGKQNKDLVGLTFAGELNLSTGGEASYKKHVFNNALTPTVAANPVENSACRVLLDAGVNASFFDTNIGAQRPDSDAFTAGKQNELITYCLPDGDNGALVLSYTIKVIN